MDEKNTSSNDVKRDVILSNIDYIMSVNNISNPTALAKTIGLAPTTWYSFLKNPVSNSSAKTCFCKHFGITVYQLENETLSEIDYDLSGSDIENDTVNNKPILSFSDDDVFKSLNRTECNGGKVSLDIKELKKLISEKMHLEYKSHILKARQEYQKGNYDTAYEHMSNAYWGISPEDLEVISERDLKCYAELCKRKDDSSGIERLVEKLILDEFYNEKIVLVLASVLESCFSDYAKLCYEFVWNKLNQ